MFLGRAGAEGDAFWPRKSCQVEALMDVGRDQHPMPGAPGTGEAGLLSNSQRNSLGIALRLVEEGLREVMRLLDEAPFEAEMHGMADDLPPDRKRAIADEVCRASEVIRGLRPRFALPRQIHAKSSLVAGKTLHMWEMVMEARARHLRGYGEVEPGLAGVLDPSVELLGTIVRRLDALVRQGANTHDSGGAGTQ